MNLVFELNSAVLSVVIIVYVLSCLAKLLQQVMSFVASVHMSVFCFLTACAGHMFPSCHLKDIQGRLSVCLASCLLG